MFRIDESKIFAEVERRKPRAVAFAAPDGILALMQETAFKVQERYGVDVLILADPCYGSCDIAEEDAERLDLDIIFHVGHGIAYDQLGRRTVIISAFDEASFENVLEKSLVLLKDYGRIGLCSISQHLDALQPAKMFLESKGFTVLIGRGRDQLRDGQVFGCKFHTVYGVKDDVEVFLLLGQSVFHAVGVALATGRHVFMLDPYLEEVIDVNESASECWRRAVLTVYKAMDAESFGVIVGLKEGQTRLKRALSFKGKLESLGKRVQLIALREVTNDRVMQLSKIDAFIQTACPRISMDGYSFTKPILSAPQAEALIQLLSGGKDFEDFLKKPHWL